MKVNKRVARRKRTTSEKITRLARRIYRAGYREMQAGVVYVSPGERAPVNWDHGRDFEEKRKAIHLADVLTRRLQNLVTR